MNTKPYHLIYLVGILLIIVATFVQSLRPEVTKYTRIGVQCGFALLALALLLWLAYRFQG
jgi:hypothetical protein